MMTVAELIEKLESMDQESEVMFSYDIEDRSHTEVAMKVDDVDEVEVAFSDYHNMYRVLSPDGDDARSRSTVTLLR
jgi:hypothetical protein